MRIGYELGLPDVLVFKAPSDGLSGITDEEKLGATYVDVHRYLRNKISSLSVETLEKIVTLNKKSAHKLISTPMAPYKDK